MALGLVPPYVAQPPAAVASFAVNIPISTDVSAALGTATLGSVGTHRMIDTSAGDADVTATCCVGPPTVSGSLIVQVVTALAAGHSYQIEYGYAKAPPDDTGELLPAIQPITCQY
jgi:hypothetical protein